MSSRKPYVRRRYWNEPEMGWYERWYFFEVCGGLRITGGVFLANMFKWMTGRKGALTAYYRRRSVPTTPPGNRGKHILTQRPDGRPQCVACNMCATVCPAQCIEIDAAFDPDDPAHPKYPSRFEIDYSRLRVLRILRRGLPRGRHPHAQGDPGPARLRPQPDVDHPGGAAPLAAAAGRGQAPIPWRIAAPAGVRRERIELMLWFFCAAALAGGVLMLLARHPMRVALALIGCMISLAGIYALLGVHVIAVFQVLIYVGAVMVFMVYVIMLLDLRDTSFLERYGPNIVPAVVLAALLAAALGAAAGNGRIVTRRGPRPVPRRSRRSVLRGGPVLEGVPGALLAALRADLGTAARGRGGRDRRHPHGPEARWIGRSCCSGSPSRCSASASSG